MAPCEPERREQWHEQNCFSVTAAEGCILSSSSSSQSSSSSSQSSSSQSSPTSSSTISQDMLHLKIRGCLANSAREPWIWWKPFNCHCHCQSPPQIYWSVGSDYFFRLLNLPLPEPELTQVAPSTHPVPTQYPPTKSFRVLSQIEIIVFYSYSARTVSNFTRIFKCMWRHFHNAILPSKRRNCQETTRWWVSECWRPPTSLTTWTTTRWDHEKDTVRRQKDNLELTRTTRR